MLIICIVPRQTLPDMHSDCVSRHVTSLACHVSPASLDPRSDIIHVFSAVCVVGPPQTHAHECMSVHALDYRLDI